MVGGSNSGLAGGWWTIMGLFGGGRGVPVRVNYGLLYLCSYLATCSFISIFAIDIEWRGQHEFRKGARSRDALKTEVFFVRDNIIIHPISWIAMFCVCACVCGWFMAAFRSMGVSRARKRSDKWRRALFTVMHGVRTACDAPFTRGIINDSLRKKQLSRHLNFPK